MTRRLICHNKTRETLVADKVRKADTYFARLFGLLPKKSLEAGEGLWIIPCKDIHSIGMKFAFDALFLDKDLKVVHLIERMKPLRISPLVRGAKTVLEVDAGVIAASQTQVGDELAFEEK
jgi:uncharacterized protein